MIGAMIAGGLIACAVVVMILILHAVAMGGEK